MNGTRFRFFFLFLFLSLFLIKINIYIYIYAYFFFSLTSSAKKKNTNKNNQLIGGDWINKKKKKKKMIKYKKKKKKKKTSAPGWAPSVQQPPLKDSKSWHWNDNNTCSCLHKSVKKKNTTFTSSYFHLPTIELSLLFIYFLFLQEQRCL